MTAELLAFLNFSFEKKQISTKIVENDTITTATRWQMNWRDYLKHLESKGIDASSDSRPSLSRYGLPQADCGLVDDLTSFQLEIRSLLTRVQSEKVIPDFFWKRIFRESDGLAVFMSPPKTFDGDIRPDNINKLNLSYNYEAPTYRIFITAILRELIVNNQIFNLKMTTDGQFYLESPSFIAFQNAEPEKIIPTSTPEVMVTTLAPAPVAPPLANDTPVVAIASDLGSLQSKEIHSQEPDFTFLINQPSAIMDLKPDYRLEPATTVAAAPKSRPSGNLDAVTEEKTLPSPTFSHATTITANSADSTLLNEPIELTNPYEESNAGEPISEPDFSSPNLLAGVSFDDTSSSAPGHSYWSSVPTVLSSAETDLNNKASCPPSNHKNNDPKNLTCNDSQENIPCDDQRFSYVCPTSDDNSCLLENQRNFTEPVNMDSQDSSGSPSHFLTPDNNDSLETTSFLTDNNNSNIDCLATDTITSPKAESVIDVSTSDHSSDHVSEALVIPDQEEPLILNNHDNPTNPTTVTMIADPTVINSLASDLNSILALPPEPDLDPSLWSSQPIKDSVNFDTPAAETLISTTTNDHEVTAGPFSQINDTDTEKPVSPALADSDDLLDLVDRIEDDSETLENEDYQAEKRLPPDTTTPEYYDTVKPAPNLFPVELRLATLEYRSVQNFQAKNHAFTCKPSDSISYLD